MDATLESLHFIDIALERLEDAVLKTLVGLRRDEANHTIDLMLRR
jgi:hypothetical protein